jgi:hypothetical protein
VRLSEAPGFGQPITVYDPRSKGAESYRALAREVARREPPEVPMPSYEDLPTIVMPAPRETEAAASQPHPDDVGVVEVPSVRDIVVEGNEDTAGGLTEPTRDFTHVEQKDPGMEPVERADPVMEPVAERDREAPASKATTRRRPTVVDPDRELSPEDEPASGPETSTDVVSSAPSPSAAAPTSRNGHERHTAPTSTTPATSATATTRPPDEDIWEPDEPDVRVRAVRIETSPGRPPERRVVVIDDDLPDRATDPAGSGSGDVAAEEGAEIGSTLRDNEAGGKRRWRLFRKGGL